MLRALDGRPEMWPWLVDYTQFNLDHWLKKRVSDPQLFYGLREGSFALHDAVHLAQTLPADYPNATAIRAQLIADIESVTVNYFGRLQQSDGSWRWDDPDYVDADGGQLKGVMQPFMVGLLLSALVDAHQVVTTPAAKESIKNQILKACRHLFNDGPYIKDQVEQKSGKKIRGFHYFYHGGTTVNPTKYEKGDIPNPWTAAEEWYVPSSRQAISTIVGAYGYAFLLSGDPWFKSAGDELWNSAYSGDDGLRAMANDTAKNYSQHYRFAGRYLVWRGGSTPSASPTVTATPIASPITESPNNTRIPTALQIVDSSSATWTRAANGNILRNGQGTSGVGSQVLYCQRAVYAFGTDSQWYRWSSGWSGIGVVDPCGAVPSPSATPTPTPAVSPSPKPSATPTPLPSPTASPSPAVPNLPICGPNQVIGDPVKCLCITGVKNNCRCR